MVNSNGFDESVIPTAILKIERLYVKEINCKIPYAPGLFESTEFKETMGQMVPSIEVSTKVQPLSEHKYEVTLHATVNGKVKNLSFFTLEIQQSGIFVVNVPQAQLKQIIETNCASYLHVYLSQAISNAIIQASFPTIVLQPLIKQGITEQNYGNKQESFSQSIKHV